MHANSLQTNCEPTVQKPNSESSTLVLANLTTESKQRVWSYLVEHNQKLASSLQKASEDDVVKTLLDEFDASLTIDSASIPASLRNSLKFIQ